MEWIIEHYSQISHKLIIIHTLENNEEDVLIKHTTLANEENDRINNFLKSNKDVYICIYGKNAHDTKMHDKYSQLKELGFVNTYLYIGGLFEWLLLQQLYGEDTYQIYIHPMIQQRLINNLHFNSEYNNYEKEYHHLDNGLYN